MASLDKVIEFFFLIKKPTTARSVKYGAAMRRAKGRPCLYVHHFMKNSGQTVGASSISAAQEFIFCLSAGVLGWSCHGPQTVTFMSWILIRLTCHARCSKTISIIHFVLMQHHFPFKAFYFFTKAKQLEIFDAASGGNTNPSMCLWII